MSVPSVYRSSTPSPTNRQQQQPTNPVAVVAARTGTPRSRQQHQASSGNLPPSSNQEGGVLIRPLLFLPLSTNSSHPSNNSNSPVDSHNTVRRYITVEVGAPLRRSNTQDNTTPSNRVITQVVMPQPSNTFYIPSSVIHEQRLPSNNSAASRATENRTTASMAIPLSSASAQPPQSGNQQNPSSSLTLANFSFDRRRNSTPVIPNHQNRPTPNSTRLQAASQEGDHNLSPQQRSFSSHGRSFTPQGGGEQGRGNREGVQRLPSNSHGTAFPPRPIRSIGVVQMRRPSSQSASTLHSENSGEERAPAFVGAPLESNAGGRNCNNRRPSSQLGIDNDGNNAEVGVGSFETQTAAALNQAFRISRPRFVALNRFRDENGVPRLFAPNWSYQSPLVLPNPFFHSIIAQHPNILSASSGVPPGFLLEHSPRHGGGIPSNLLESLPVERFRRCQRGDAGNQNTCLVCQLEYSEEDDLRRLPCFHHFHVNCIDTWLVERDSCPVCRLSVLDGLEQCDISSPETTRSNPANRTSMEHGHRRRRASEEELPTFPIQRHLSTPARAAATAFPHLENRAIRRDADLRASVARTEEAGGEQRRPFPDSTTEARVSQPNNNVRYVIEPHVYRRRTLAPQSPWISRPSGEDRNQRDRQVNDNQPRRGSATAGIPLLSGNVAQPNYAPERISSTTARATGQFGFYHPADRSDAPSATPPRPMFRSDGAERSNQQPAPHQAATSCRPVFNCDGGVSGRERDNGAGLDNPPLQASAAEPPKEQNNRCRPGSEIASFEAEVNMRQVATGFPHFGDTSTGNHFVHPSASGFVERTSSRVISEAEGRRGGTADADTTSVKDPSVVRGATTHGHSIQEPQGLYPVTPRPTRMPSVNNNSGQATSSPSSTRPLYFAYPGNPPGHFGTPSSPSGRLRSVPFRYFSCQSNNDGNAEAPSRAELRPVATTFIPDASVFRSDANVIRSNASVVRSDASVFRSDSSVPPLSGAANATLSPRRPPIHRSGPDPG